MSNPFTLSIETSPGQSKQHGFHLGTNEVLARQIAEGIFKCRVDNGYPVMTVALKREGKLIDVFYGDYWHSRTFA